jgi:hypothetical protein
VPATYRNKGPYPRTESLGDTTLDLMSRRSIWGFVAKLATEPPRSLWSWTWSCTVPGHKMGCPDKVGTGQRKFES